ncbi:MAG: nicotinate-nucleotide adenylyltransferase [Microbacteriaceae bacterium]
MARPTQVGIFGGTFDPPHLGHLIAAQAAVEQLGLERMLWVPTAESYHKGVGISAEHRAEMVKLAIADDDRFELSLVDIERGGATYSIDTLNDLEQMHPMAEFTFVMGHDSWESIDNWKRSAELCARATVAVVNRAGSTGAPATERLRWVEIPSIGISSTECRQRVRAGLSLSYWTPLGVGNYIAQHKLYLEGQ